MKGLEGLEALHQAVGTEARYRPECAQLRTIDFTSMLAAAGYGWPAENYHPSFADYLNSWWHDNVSGWQRMFTYGAIDTYVEPYLDDDTMVSVCPSEAYDMLRNAVTVAAVREEELRREAEQPPEPTPVVEPTPPEPPAPPPTLIPIEPVRAAVPWPVLLVLGAATVAGYFIIRRRKP